MVYYKKCTFYSLAKGFWCRKNSKLQCAVGSYEFHFKRKITERFEGKFHNINLAKIVTFDLLNMNQKFCGQLFTKICIKYKYFIDVHTFRQPVGHLWVDGFHKMREKSSLAERLSVSQRE